MVELSKALNNNGKISDRMSSCGVFSKMICRFSNMVTVAWIDFGAAKTTLCVSTNNKKKERQMNINNHRAVCISIVFFPHR